MIVVDAIAERDEFLRIVFLGDFCDCIQESNDCLRKDFIESWDFLRERHVLGGRRINEIFNRFTFL